MSAEELARFMDEVFVRRVESMPTHRYHGSDLRHFDRNKEYREDVIAVAAAVLDRLDVPQAVIVNHEER